MRMGVSQLHKPRQNVLLMLLAVLLIGFVWPVVAAEYRSAAPVRPVPKQGWLTLETPHFLIHFPPGEEATARELATAAENAHRLLAPRLEHIPEAKTHVVLADTSDAANAATIVSPYNIIYINPVLPGVGYLSGFVPLSATTWYSIVFLHEYAHLLHLDLDSGLSAQMRQIFGRLPGIALPNVYQAPAILEGYAIHQESATGNGRGNNAFYSMFLRAAIQQQTVPPWDAFLGNYSAWRETAGPAYYLFGYALVDYIARIYGEDKLTEVLRVYTEKPLEGVAAAVGNVLKVPLPTLWESCLQELERKNAQHQSADAQPLSYEQIPQVGSTALWPELSPDGSRIAYGSIEGVVPAIRLHYVGQTSGSKTQDELVVNGLFTGGGGIAWRPDGQRLAYAKMEYDSDNRLFSDIYVFDLQEKREQRLTTGYRAYGPTFAPSGDFLAFITRQGTENRILVQAYPEGQPEVLWSAPNDPNINLGEINALAWSPKGDCLAFTASLDSGGMGIFLLPVSRHGKTLISGRMQTIATSDNLYLDLSWSADARYLFFSSDKDGDFAIHAVTPDTKTLYRIGSAMFGVFAPCAAADGRSIVAAAYDSTGYHLVRLPLLQTTWQQWPAQKAEVAQPVQPVLKTFRLSAQELAQAANSGPTPTTSTRVAGRTLADWEKDLMRSVDPASYIVRPYDARESITPGYWQPVYGGQDDLWLTGVSTKVSDALNNQQYTLGLQVGGTGVGFDLGYTWRPVPLGADPAFSISLAGKRAGNIDETADAAATDGSASELKVTATMSLSHCSALRTTALTLSAAYISAMQPSSTLSAVVADTLIGGNGLLHTSRITRGELDLNFLEAKKVTNARWEWGSEVYWPGAWKLAAKFVTAASTDPEAYTLNATASGMDMRGWQQKSLTGQLVGKVTVAAHKVIWSVERGWQDKPVYLSQVSGGLFVEAGAVGAGVASGASVVGTQNLQAAAAYGAEIVTSLSFYYGKSNVDLRLGIARLADGSQPYAVDFRVGY